jgi:hypothetical protein
VALFLAFAACATHNPPTPELLGGTLLEDIAGVLRAFESSGDAAAFRTRCSDGFWEHGGEPYVQGLPNSGVGLRPLQERRSPSGERSALHYELTVGEEVQEVGLWVFVIGLPGAPTIDGLDRTEDAVQPFLDGALPGSLAALAPSDALEKIVEELLGASRLPELTGTLLAALPPGAGAVVETLRDLAPAQLSGNHWAPQLGRGALCFSSEHITKPFCAYLADPGDGLRVVNLGMDGLFSQLFMADID